MRDKFKEGDKVCIISSDADVCFSDGWWRTGDPLYIVKADGDGCPWVSYEEGNNDDCDCISDQYLTYYDVITSKLWRVLE